MAADPSLVAELRLQAELGRIKTKVGGTLSAIPPQGLVNASKGWFYPIHGDIGDLLAEDAIQIPPMGRDTEPG